MYSESKSFSFKTFSHLKYHADITSVIKPEYVFFNKQFKLVQFPLNMMYNNHNSPVDDELGLYTKILECYNKAGNNTEKLEFCKNKSILRLMEAGNRRENQEKIKNGLIFILNLFNEENKDPDLFTGLGKDESSLSQEEKRKLIKQLKQEMV
ncbi:MAG: hypothetical protein R6U96_11415 [Promethearchaeia archaeon]